MAELLIKKSPAFLNQDLAIPIGELVAVVGVSASGKSRFLDLAAAQLDHVRGKRKVSSINSDAARDVAGAAGLSLPIARVFADSASARRAGLHVESFLLEKPDGRCGMCRGTGVKKLDLEGYGLLSAECPHCFGHRFSPEALLITFAERTIADLFELKISALREVFAAQRSIAPLLETLCGFDLGHVVLGQPLAALSQSQLARLELARVVMQKEKSKRTLCLEQPFADLSQSEALDCMRKIRAWVSERHTLLFTTHDPFVIRHADRLIEFEAVGRVSFFGTPSEYDFETFQEAGERLRTGS